MIGIFRAKKMIDRVIAEGKGDMLTPETIEFINSLEGKSANTYNWQSQVFDENLAYISPDADQDGTYVSILDCDF